ncbi:hypothetical protein H5410_049763 [Solanum commersonii]|uniref:Proteasome alpha-type subunits domain-containing protein n=1 Tax=Solanum commersonii TaxID=4109 RepID=A0A9J5WVY1_SOLCO|nr:hypothetical protein H5410_049763 [Solanum commersonii]
MGDSQYSFSLTTFSPSGKLVQIEHALTAVGSGQTSLGIKAANGVVIATEKKLPSILVDETSVQKIQTLTPNIGVVYSGMGPDSRVLVRKSRKQAEQYYRLYKESIPVTQLVRETAAVMQEFTQSGGVRPFGVSLLVAGYDDKGPQLYQVDPSGSYFSWKASAMGKNVSNAKTFLEKRYTEELELDDAVHTAILTLKEGFEGQISGKNIEIGIIGNDKNAKMTFSFKLDTANPGFLTITNKSIHDPLLTIATKRRILGFKVSASSSSSSSSSSRSAKVFEEGQLERPRWSGETPLSRLVGTLISIKPLFSILKLGARQAAAEADAATMSMVRRAIPNASSLEEANQIVRGNWLDAIEKHHQQYSADFSIRDILDIGCSVGVSTGYLADRFPSAKVTGLDLSPYFLSVAQYKEKKRNQRKNPISWIHANGENTGLPSESFDLVSIPYVFHECPERAIRNIVKESFRLLRPGGTIAITDNSPKSKILQELPPVLFTLMKSTEPFLDEYYLTDLERVIKEAGFANVQTVLTDPRHRTVTATVPY